MGAVELLIYNKFNFSIDFINAFMNMKSRGPNDTTLNTYSTVDISNLTGSNYNTVISNLTKNELATYKQWNFTLGYHRLIINDTSFNGSQPFIDPIQTMVNRKVNGVLICAELKTRPIRQLICNGEIYNYDSLVSEFNFGQCDLSSNCDVEIILPLYIKDYNTDITVDRCLINALNLLDGDFAFILTENINTYQLSTLNCFCARDPFGIKPMYYVKNNLNIYIFVSEIKALPTSIIQNPTFYINYLEPGNFWSFQNTINSTNNGFTKYYNIDKYMSLDNCILNNTNPDTLNDIYSNIQNIIQESIISRYNSSQKPVGILLSGGFDSCLLTALLIKYLVSISNDFTTNALHIFTIGDTNSIDDLDCIFAKEFVEYLEAKYSIDLNHHIININNIELLTTENVINEIIYALESYEPTTVRDSIPFYYLLRYISENSNVKVLISGDGLNELGGYKNFKGLDDQTFQECSVNLIKNMYKYNLLRTDKLSGNFGLEIRQPFINKTFIEYMLSIHPKIKRENYFSNDQSPITKYIIRKAFDNSIYGEQLIPDDYLWRTQSTITNSLTNFQLRLNHFFETNMTNDYFNTNLSTLRSEGQYENTLPITKEEMYYRLLFRKNFPNRDYIVDSFWTDIWPNN